MDTVKTIFDFIDNKEILSYARTLKTDSYFGFSLFPIKQVSEINYEYIKGSYGQKANIMAEVVAYESSSPGVGRDGLVKVSGKLPPIKQKSRIGEQEIIKLFSPRSILEREEAKSQLYNDVADRVDGVYSRLNRIICDSLAYGSVTFAGEGVKLKVDWNVPAGHKTTVAKSWSDTTSDPVSDIMAAVQTIIDDTGVRVNRGLTSTLAITNLLRNEKLQSAIFGSANTARNLTSAIVNEYLVSLGLPALFAFDEVVRRVDPATQAVVTERYFPQTQLTMFSSNETLGETLIGPTAEGIVGVGTEEAPGIWAEIMQTKDPVNIYTMATAVGFPTFPGSEAVAMLNLVKP